MEDQQEHSILEIIHQVIVKIVRTFDVQNNYLDEDDPWSGILASKALAVQSMHPNRLQDIRPDGFQTLHYIKYRIHRILGISQAAQTGIIEKVTKFKTKTINRTHIEYLINYWCIIKRKIRCQRYIV